MLYAFRCSLFAIPEMQLPINLAFLRGIDLGDINAFVIKEDLHIIEKKLVRIGVRYVKAEVIDKLLLFLLPFGPAILAHFRTDLLTKLGRYRRKADRLLCQPAASAFEFVARK